jgi:hypothetical protein
MTLPFLAHAPSIELRDPLAEVLGVLEPGATFRYTYEDVVKLSGHSCPTVAGAFLMTVEALRRLYPERPPARGEVEVVVGGDPTDGSAGPMSQVIAHVTGAAPETGFLGLMGRWRRASLLRFDPANPGRIRFRRTDTGATVDATYDPSAVPPDARLQPLLVGTLTGRATAEETRRFGELWQDRVGRILTGDPSHVVRLKDAGVTGTPGQRA